MSGVNFLLAMSAGFVALIFIANVRRSANEGHERDGLYGAELRRRRLALDELARQDAEEQARIEMAALADMIAALDRISFAGVPVNRVDPTGEPTWWTVSFRDGTSLCVRAEDHRSMVRANSLAGSDPLVVTRVVPTGNSAVVELACDRHRPLRVALRA